MKTNELKMTKVFVLDDSDERLAWFEEKMKDYNLTTCSSVPEAKAKWGTGDFDVLFLDHDLGNEETGVDFCEFVAESTSREKYRVVVHSHNPGGAENMTAALPQDRFVVPAYPFGRLVRAWDNGFVKF